MISFSVNKQRVNLDVDPAIPLLWVLRDNLGLTGISIIVQFICTFAVWIFAERIGLSPIIPDILMDQYPVSALCRHRPFFHCANW